MKKIFIAIVALAAATACSNSEIVSVNREAIAFDNAFINNSVRSVIDPSYKYDTKMFADFAVYGFVSADNQAPAAIFNGTQVVGPNWTYEGTQYWIDDADYTFHAVAPLTSGNWTNAVATTEGVSLTFNNTTANGASKGENDLLYATNDYGVYNYVEDTAVGKVGFNFRHVLSKVKFSFENAYNASSATIKVKDIVITNPHKTANVVLTDVTVWSDNAAANDFTLAFGMATDDEATTATKENAEVAYAYGATYESQNERFLIPSNSYAYNVTFTVELLVSNTKVATYYHTVTAEFAPEAGKSYDIKAVINAANIDPNHAQEPIEFTVNTLPGWTSGSDVNAEYPQKN